MSKINKLVYEVTAIGHVVHGVELPIYTSMVWSFSKIKSTNYLLKFGKKFTRFQHA